MYYFGKKDLLNYNKLILSILNKMTQTIPPRARDTPLMSYYTTGRNDTLLRPGRFRNFSAEPVIFT
jgi:hypothetical protein